MKKVLFCINVTDNKKNDQTDELSLVTKRLDGYQQEELDRIRNDSQEIQNSYTLPLYLTIIKSIAFLMTLIIAVGVISSYSAGNTIEQSFNNAPFLFYIFPFSLITGISITIYDKRRKSKVEESPEINKIEEQSNTLFSNVKAELDIPDDAIEMDFLGFKYKVVDNKIKVVNTGMLQYLNLGLFCYVKENKLCIANLEQLIEISLDDFVSIERVNKNFVIPYWNKEQSLNEEPYKKYKLKANNFGMIFVNPTYIVTFNINNQIYDLYVPVYEISDFIKMTGIKYNDEFVLVSN
jgi:hypothetical protein